MLKICELVHRRPGLSVEQFQAYWRETHGPIVATIPGIRRYVQSHPLPGGYGKAPLAWDGVAEIWVDDKAALQAMSRTPAFAAAKADEPNFIDSDRLEELLTHEEVIVDGAAPAGGVKAFMFLNRRADLTPEAFQAHWRAVHGPIVAGYPRLRRYVQSHVRLGRYRKAPPPACDGIAVLWFDAVDDMRAGTSSEAAIAARADGDRFLAPDPVPLVITRERVVLDHVGAVADAPAPADTGQR